MTAKVWLNPVLERGDRVRLVHCSDPWTILAPGTLGTVDLIDSTGSMHVTWDNGSHLALASRMGDRWARTTEPKPTASLDELLP
jgi:hypothetical protein